jgi:intracellular proteinase inhibitor BsuPI
LVKLRPASNRERSLRPNLAGSGRLRSTLFLVLGFMSRPSLSPSRVAIALLCAGALAFACGPRTHSEAASTATLAAAAPVLQQGTPHARTDGVPLASNVDIKLEHDGVRFALLLTNETKKHVELTFPSGQTHEFVVVDSIGREVWRWSTTRLFTQAVQNKLLSSGETMRVSEQWPHPSKRGKYTLIATLNSTNFPIQQRAEFLLP